MGQTQLILLGTGTPNLEPHRFQASLAVVVDDSAYIVDCGGGTMQRLLQAFHDKDIAALAPKKLTRLFLTHLHPDHTVGLADFLIGPWVDERDETVQIYGPTGTDAMVKHLLQAYVIGIGEHQHGLAPIAHPLDVVVIEIEAGVIYQDELVAIEAFRVSHGGLDAFGFKFQTSEKTIVISGDTCPTPSLIEQAKGCDILVHEVYSAKQLKRRSMGWQAYHQKMHTSTIELAEIANKVRPKLLVLTHQLPWQTTLEKLREEIAELYNGEVVNGCDLDIDALP